MVTLMNDYVNQMKLVSDDVTKGIMSSALLEQPVIAKHNIMVKSNKYIVDITLENFTVDNAIQVMNTFMENTRFHYSALFIRFNEGDRVRYRYATCREDKEGFYCDVVIS